MSKSTELDPSAEWIGAIVRGDLERAERVRAEHPGLPLRDARFRLWLIRAALP
jgi:hypothetical protein